ncbi:MAG: nucleotidyltransferase family protein [Leptospiraceae bacterium]
MKNWKDILLRKEDSLVDAIQKIDASGAQIAIIADEQGKLEGVLTDGDVRRSILKGYDLKVLVKDVMNRNPRTVLASTPSSEILHIMRKNTYHQIPLVDEEGRVAGLITLDELIGATDRPNRVVLMAGGQGKRLHPLTIDTPKPLLQVGGRPILESIVQRFADQGFVHFFISVNYKAEMICDYFGNGERWGVNIQYIHEDKSLGTAGALSLIEEQLEDPIIVMNGDLLTHVNFNFMLKFHLETDSVATMAVREYDFEVPYGVVSVENQRIREIEEKPIHRFFVNAGIYVLSPEALSYLPQNQHLNMTTLFDTLVAQDRIASAYPLREYWLDIGRMSDYEKAKNEYGLIEDVQG